ncbi:hypothetical protein L208DRAFT_1375875 [Tricholoma matsutake]|nr:hypothetical protein L208DRAFT_1375875 [Tricholoma matsutake 945]
MSKAGQVSRKTEDDYPLILLAFDEAHTLTNREETGYATWSNFSILRHVFHLGFDTLAKKVALDGHWNLEHVTADSHIVYMACPLHALRFGSCYDAGDRSIQEDIVTFAVGKLLNADPST